MKVALCLGLIVCLGFFSPEVDGCAAKQYPSEYRKPQPDVLYFYDARKDLPANSHLKSLEGLALPGEACNYNHIIKAANPGQTADYRAMDAACVQEPILEISSECHYVYDKEGKLIMLGDHNITVTNHPGDKHFNKAASVEMGIPYKKCMCPYKVQGDLVYHNSWDTTLHPARPSCTYRAPPVTGSWIVGPWSRGYTCMRVQEKK